MLVNLRRNVRFFVSLKSQKSPFALQEKQLKYLVCDLTCLWGVLCGYTHIFPTKMFAHMYTGTKRVGGHSHFDTRWGLSCFSNCFPHPTQLIQSHLYDELNLTHKQSANTWVELRSVVLSFHVVAPGRGRKGRDNKKACKRKDWNATHSLSLCLSLSHTHARLSDSALLLSEMIGWLVYKCHLFIFYYRSHWHFKWIICLWKNVFWGPWKSSHVKSSSFIKRF